MSKSEIVVIESQHEHVLFTLEEVCERCDIHVDIIVEMIEYGIAEPVEPIEQSTESIWYFNSHALVRLQRAQRLMNGLELNLSGVALSLELMDEIEELQQRIDILSRQLP
ncbi:molecular chaperone [Marinomonas sp. UCMA 3892]|jgi:chaperone modulatory protein CbpM|uniref:chaperone modulator CbpM n=1 Tax=unclassified Marinomonas TaxID=196814 RepID=UPI001469B3DE|nr:chaperone modulator CbpM [Marinomonas sp. UCMA 3892]NLU98570.1 molecular chaperone [Marinomonas sp. UCMA 3892]